MRRIYLDHNATAPMLEEALDATIKALRDLSGNPSSLHREGQRARAAVEGARRSVARLIGAHATEITFTSGATEANNLALHTLHASTDPALAIATSTVEHPSILAPIDRLEAAGRKIVRLGVDAEGMIGDPEATIARLEAENVGALSLMWANNETGNLFPIEALLALCHARGWHTHCDATQAAGRLSVNAEALGVDMLSVSAHKFGGPKGVGALYLKSGTDLSALIVGGHQERGRRGGTEDVAAIVGMGAAADATLKHRDIESQRTRALRDALWTGIQAIEPGAVRQTHATESLPNTLNVRFDDVDGETLLINLDLEGIAASAGSACTAGSLEPSHVILAMGVPATQARGSVRFSLGPGNTQQDIDDVLQRLPGVLSRSRAPGW